MAHPLAGQPAPADVPIDVPTLLTAYFDAPYVNQPAQREPYVTVGHPSPTPNHRCSKCHTLGRIYARLDTLERSLTTLERMRLKTGSGITDHDFRLLEDYLRTQF